jgi:hypothetical protein
MVVDILRYSETKFVIEIEVIDPEHREPALIADLLASTLIEGMEQENIEVYVNEVKKEDED